MDFLGKAQHAPALGGSTGLGKCRLYLRYGSSLSSLVIAYNHYQQKSVSHFFHECCVAIRSLECVMACWRRASSLCSLGLLGGSPLGGSLGGPGSVPRSSPFGPWVCPPPPALGPLARAPCSVGGFLWEVARRGTLELLDDSKDAL